MRLSAICQAQPAGKPVAGVEGDGYDNDVSLSGALLDVAAFGNAAPYGGCLAGDPCGSHGGGVVG